MINDKDFLLIEAYVGGTLEGESKTSFEKRLRQEKELNKYLSLVLESDLFLEEFDKQQKIQEWTALLHERPTKPSFIKTLASVRHSRAGRYALSMAAMLLIFLTVYVWLPFSNPSPDQLASQYWSKTAHFSYAEAQRGDTPKTLEKTTKKIYDLHAEGEYRTALQEIEELSVTDEKLTLLKGSCYYNLDEIDNAINAFKQITQLQNSYTEDEAKWYLALCYLKKGNMEEGKKELQRIVANKGWNYKHANILLKEI